MRETAIEFCEPTYVRHPQVAEFWNTISSLAYCVPAVMLLYQLPRYKSRYPKYFGGLSVYKFWFVAFSWISLGLGSAAFHMTQTKWAEIWDESGMMLSVFSLCFGMSDIHPWTTSRRASRFYVSVVIFVAFCLLWYVQIMYHPFFVGTFILTSLIPLGLFATLPLFTNAGSVKLYKEKDASPRSGYKFVDSQSYYPYMDTVASVKYGIFFTLLAFAIWHIDQSCVANKWPQVNPIYELDWWQWAHPLWHIFTTVGESFFIDSLLKARIQTYKSPLMRRAHTGSFIHNYSFVGSVRALLRMGQTS